MAVSIPQLIPDVKVLLEMEPEDLAGPLLQYLASLPERDQHLVLSQVIDSLDVAAYPAGRREDVLRAITEAWVWLEREGLIAPRPNQTQGWIFVTRRGRKAASSANLAAYRHANLLPRNLLHPQLVQKVWAAFGVMS